LKGEDCKNDPMSTKDASQKREPRWALKSRPFLPEPSKKGGGKGPRIVAETFRRIEHASRKRGIKKDNLGGGTAKSGDASSLGEM